MGGASTQKKTLPLYTGCWSRICLKPKELSGWHESPSGCEEVSGLNYTVVANGAPPPDLARKIAEAHAKAIARQRGSTNHR